MLKGKNCWKNKKKGGGPKKRGNNKMQKKYVNNSREGVITAVVNIIRIIN